MKKIISLFTALMLTINFYASDLEIDRPWYLAGEAMKVTVKIDNEQIAYAELCDKESLAACTVFGIYEGKGTGIVELPEDIHSGYYQLNVYSKGNAKVYSCLVPVINVIHKSNADAIKWVKIEGKDTLSYPIANQNNGELYNFNLTKPVELREVEGHIVKAHVNNFLDGKKFSANDIRPSLSIVGKQIHYFEGKMLNDTTAVFYTYGLRGKQPLVLSAATNTGKSLPIQMISPYACIFPQKLPYLYFHYQRQEVEKRSKEMQLHQIAIKPEEKEATIGSYADAATEEGVPMNYDPHLYDKLPDLSYNLDEWRQFHTIHETLTEYVNHVKKDEIKGVTHLVTRGEVANYDKWPAMVFIDGMPVIDIDRLLKYDARRIHYINIYSDKFTFGNGVYKGVVSFISRSGRLTNYPPEPNVQYLVYEFPE